VAKPLEIVEHGSDQLLSPGILCCGRFGKKGEEIARLLGKFMPPCRWRRDEVRFEFVLSLPQRSLIGLHLRQQPTKIGGLLSRHSTMLVEIDRLLGNSPAPQLEE
jgi:hypothetical protein